MTKKLIKKIFPLLALLLLAPWPVAYAHDNDGAAQETIQVTIADSSAAPSATAFGKAISGVTPGDLFYIDATENVADIKVILYLTNAQELIHFYRYMNQQVGVYVEGSNGEGSKPSRSRH